jgi:hypothetical protein
MAQQPGESIWFSAGHGRPGSLAHGLFLSLLAGRGRDPELFPELWRACAGPLVEVPQRDERVFYFLQGHLEQVRCVFWHRNSPWFLICARLPLFCSIHFPPRIMLVLRVQLQEPTDPALLAEQIKMFQVPYKILCKVVNVELKVRT